MRAFVRFLIVVGSWSAVPASAQPADAVVTLLARLEQVLSAGADATAGTGAA